MALKMSTRQLLLGSIRSSDKGNKKYRKLIADRQRAARKHSKAGVRRQKILGGKRIAAAPIGRTQKAAKKRLKL